MTLQHFSPGVISVLNKVYNQGRMISLGTWVPAIIKGLSTDVQNFYSYSPIFGCNFPILNSQEAKVLIPFLRFQKKGKHTKPGWTVDIH